jgi:dTDP-4-dehydrorhamnose 3,5-epimerase
MRVAWSEMAGVKVVSPRAFTDTRGIFLKLHDEGVNGHGRLSVSQVAAARNSLRGTIRGLHLQTSPNEETKTLWCSSGEIWDVLVDTRTDQATYGHWAAVRLGAEEMETLTVPPGVAHGYQTLIDDSAIVYLIDGRYEPRSARTLAWDDPTVGIEWPLPPTAISENDRAGAPWPL